MERKMTKAQIEAWFDDLDKRRRPPPKVVVKDDAVIRDADAHVSREDPNHPGSDEGVVRVRRSDWVTVRMDLWEAQQEWKQEQRRRRRELDPFRLGHWGPTDDDDAA
jgi:hypothetical protein